MTNQSTFKTRAAYIEWRSHWRKAYKVNSEIIRGAKQGARRPTNNSKIQAGYNSVATHGKFAARNMMMALEAAKLDYQASKMLQAMVEAYDPGPPIIGQ